MLRLIILLHFLFSFSLLAQDNLFYAGVAAVDMRPPIGIPLAGYGSEKRRLKPWDWKNEYPHAFLFKPSTGRRDPIRSKVMVIQDVRGEKLVFISLDVIGVTHPFVNTMAKMLKKHGIARDQLFISATHTHSGPGTLTRNIGLAAVAVDLFKKENYDYIASQVYKSVVIALEEARAVNLYTSSFAASGIQANKFRRKGEQWFDRSAKFLLARDKVTGQWLGGMLNFAAHGNAMPIEDLRYSADFPGAIERAVEEKIAALNSPLFESPVLLFMNGAEGDVRHKGGRGEDVMESVAEEFALQAQATALDEANMRLVQGPIKYLRKRSFIAVPGYPLEVCSSSTGFMGFLKKVIPGKNLRVPVPVFPTHSALSVAKLGDISFASWPGEASTSLGFMLKEKARQLGHNDLWILGLTNDYLTYFTTKEEYFEAKYDSCSSFYNWRGGERILRKLSKLLRKI